MVDIGKTTLVPSEVPLGLSSDETMLKHFFPATDEALAGFELGQKAGMSKAAEPTLEMFLAEEKKHQEAINTEKEQKLRLSEEENTAENIKKNVLMQIKTFVEGLLKVVGDGPVKQSLIRIRNALSGMLLSRGSLRMDAPRAISGLTVIVIPLLSTQDPKMQDVLNRGLPVLSAASAWLEALGGIYAKNEASLLGSLAEQEWARKRPIPSAPLQPIPGEGEVVEGEELYVKPSAPPEPIPGKGKIVEDEELYVKPSAPPQPQEPDAPPPSYEEVTAGDLLPTYKEQTKMPSVPVEETASSVAKEVEKVVSSLPTPLQTDLNLRGGSTRSGG